MHPEFIHLDLGASTLRVSCCERAAALVFACTGLCVGLAGSDWASHTEIFTVQKVYEQASLPGDNRVRSVALLAGHLICVL